MKVMPPGTTSVLSDPLTDNSVSPSAFHSTANLAITWDRSWMWHPDFSESRSDTAGLFVHFYREFLLEATEVPPRTLPIHITADTRYRLYVNRQFASFDPCKSLVLLSNRHLFLPPHRVEPDHGPRVTFLLRHFLCTVLSPTPIRRAEDCSSERRGTMERSTPRQYCMPNCGEYDHGTSS